MSKIGWRRVSYIQCGHKVSVHLLTTICLITWFRPTAWQRNIRLTLTPSVIPNSNYVIMVSDWNFIKCFYVFFLYCSHQVAETFDRPVYYSCQIVLGWKVKERVRRVGHVAREKQVCVPNVCVKRWWREETTPKICVIIFKCVVRNVVGDLYWINSVRDRD
jgi:hypothetical protein